MRRLPAWVGTEPHYPGYGDEQRPKPGYIRLLRGIESDNHRSEGRNWTQAPEYLAIFQLQAGC
jgi:hypothetical protein